MIKDRWLSYDSLEPAQRAQLDAAWVEPVDRMDEGEFRRLHLCEWPRPVSSGEDLDVLAALEDQRGVRQPRTPTAAADTWDRLLADGLIEISRRTGQPRMTSQGTRLVEQMTRAACRAACPRKTDR